MRLTAPSPAVLPTTIALVLSVSGPDGCDVDGAVALFTEAALRRLLARIDGVAALRAQETAPIPVGGNDLMAMVYLDDQVTYVERDYEADSPLWDALDAVDTDGSPVHLAVTPELQAEIDQASKSVDTERVQVYADCALWRCDRGENRVETVTVYRPALEEALAALTGAAPGAAGGSTAE